jgi:hypothetical protein
MTNIGIRGNNYFNSSFLIRHYKFCWTRLFK